MLDVLERELRSSFISTLLSCDAFNWVRVFLISQPLDTAWGVTGYSDRTACPRKVQGPGIWPWWDQFVQQTKSQGQWHRVRETSSPLCSVGIQSGHDWRILSISVFYREENPRTEEESQYSNSVCQFWRLLGISHLTALECCRRSL